MCVSLFVPSGGTMDYYVKFCQIKVQRDSWFEPCFCTLSLSLSLCVCVQTINVSHMVNEIYIDMKMVDKANGMGCGT